MSGDRLFCLNSGRYLSGHSATALAGLTKQGPAPGHRHSATQFEVARQRLAAVHDLVMFRFRHRLAASLREQSPYGTISAIVKS